jgi:hypothetical protein
MQWSVFENIILTQREYIFKNSSPCSDANGSHNDLKFPSPFGNFASMDIDSVIKLTGC